MIFATCKDASTSDKFEKLSVPTALLLSDIGNSNSANDINLRFNISETLQIMSFRVFIVKEEDSNIFSVQHAGTISNYFEIKTEELSKGFYSSKLPAELKDIDGDKIKNGISYKAFVLSIANNNETDSELSDPSPPIILENVSFVYTLVEELNAGSGGMETDSNGNIYMGDFGLATTNANGTKVVKITPEGQISTLTSGLFGASGNDFDKNGILYQSSIWGERITKISSNGQKEDFVTTGLSAPVGVLASNDGFVYICNCGNNSIGKIDSFGNTSIIANGPLFNCPNGIDEDQNGNIYIANFNNNIIVKITSNRHISTFAELPNNNNGHLVYHNNALYVAGRGSNQIYKVDMDGQVISFAGSGSRGNSDGSLKKASFSLPNDLAFSPDGSKIYVNDVFDLNSKLTDTYPVRIRVIELVDEIER